MLNIDLRKIYSFHPVQPAPESGSLPTAGDLYYECLDCSGIVSSVSQLKAACPCGNLAAAAGTVVVRDPARVRVVRGKLK